MPRTARAAPGGMVYHVIHRGVGRQKLFFGDEDYLAFERVVAMTLPRKLDLSPFRPSVSSLYFGQVDHFLICGSDAFIEVLAAGFEWCEVGSLET